MDNDSYSSGTVFINSIACSNNCIFCANPNKANSGKVDLSREDKIRLLKDTEALLDRNIEHLNITGLEVLRYSNIIDYIRWVRPRFKYISICDTGTSLSDMDFARSLFETGIDEISFPIYGSEEKIHNSCVMNDKAFGNLVKALENIQILQKDHDVKVFINSIFLKQNRGDMTNIIALLKRYSLKLSLVSIPIIYSSFGERSDFFTMKISEIKDELIDIFANGGNCFSINYVPPCIFSGDELSSLESIRLRNVNHQFAAGTSNPVQSSCLDNSLCYGRFCEDCHLKKKKICGGMLKYYLERTNPDEFHPLSEKTYEDNKGKLFFYGFNLFC